MYCVKCGKEITETETKQNNNLCNNCKKTIEETKKKSKLPLIIGIVIAVVVVIGIIAIIITISNKKECERLEKEWTEKRVEVGDVCVDMGYYARKIKEEANSKYPSKIVLKELSDTMDKELDEKMKHLEEEYKTMGKVKTKAQEQWREDYYTLREMDDQRNLISTRISGYSLVPNSNAVIKPCDELILIYARSDLRHNEIYSNNEQTIQRFKDASINKRYSEEVEQQNLKYIKEHYFGY